MIENPIIEAQSALNMETLEPVVFLRWGNEETVLTVEEARAHALLILNAAEAAESDSLLVKVGLEHSDNDQELAFGMLALFRKMRHEMNQLKQLNDEFRADGGITPQGP